MTARIVPHYTQRLFLSSSALTSSKGNSASICCTICLRYDEVRLSNNGRGVSRQGARGEGRYVPASYKRLTRGRLSGAPSAHLASSLVVALDDTDHRTIEQR